MIVNRHLLLQMLWEGYDPVHSLAAALKQIEPEAAAKAGLTNSSHPFLAR